MSIQREVECIEDMSPRGRLRLLQQADGDIIVVAQHMEDGLVQPGGAVEFCTSYGGGGRRGYLMITRSPCRCIGCHQPLGEPHLAGCVYARYTIQ